MDLNIVHTLYWRQIMLSEACYMTFGSLSHIKFGPSQ